MMQQWQEQRLKVLDQTYQFLTLGVEENGNFSFYPRQTRNAQSTVYLVLIVFFNTVQRHLKDANRSL